MTDSEPGDESGGNQSLIVGVTVPILAIIIILGAVAVVVAFIYWRQNTNRRSLVGSTANSDIDGGLLDVADHLLSDSSNDKPQLIPAHISFTLKDEQKELISALEKFEVS